MEQSIKLSFGELNNSNGEITFKVLTPFSLSTIQRADFAGVSVIDEKLLKRSDWAYAFRFAGMGLLLFFVWNGIGYGINGLEGTLGKFFFYTSIIFLPLVTLGSGIIFFSIWDAIFGSAITNKFLMKFFGKTITSVVIASKTGQHIKFHLISEMDKVKLNEILALNNHSI